jgi:putative two-component system protein, hydrogenase maturation factor HypX/HoxX
MTPARSPHRVLFLVSAHNSLSQRAYIAVTERGHDVEVAVVDSAAEMEEAVRRHRPDLIVCPMLKKFIPESIWARHRCLVVHPGPRGDRGPSSLDWAIELGAPEWGVTVLEANGDYDAGDIWASRPFPTRPAGKSSLYRHEVRRAAIDALVEAIDKVVAGAAPEPLDESDPRTTGRARPPMSQEVRAIDWSSDSTETVLRKIRAAEGHPGVVDEVEGVQFPSLRGPQGEAAGRRPGPGHRSARRRDLPRDERRGGVDHPPEARVQAPRHPRARPGRMRARRPRGAGAPP